MDVGDLIELLKTYPKNAKVYIETSRTFENYGEVASIEKGYVIGSPCGSSFKPAGSITNVNPDFYDKVIVLRDRWHNSSFGGM